MKPPRENAAAVQWSGKLYRCLLIAYPASHRREYGPAMTQLFRDQCHDAWNKTRWRGLVALWFHTLPDLVNTSIIERLAAIKGKEFTFRKMLMQKPSKIAIAASIAIFISIFLLVLTTTTIVSYLLPEKYMSSARIMLKLSVLDPSGAPNNPAVIDLIPSELAVIQSEVILDEVIENLNLNQLWGKKYFNNGTPLKTSESRRLLKRQLELHPLRNTTLVEIRAYSDDKNEAAKVANEVAAVYKQFRVKTFRELQAAIQPQQPKVIQVQIIDLAEPSPKPAYPNHSLNIFIGGLLATVAGATAGGLFLLVASRKSPPRHSPPAITPQMQT